MASEGILRVLLTISLWMVLGACADDKTIFNLSNKVDESSGIVASRTYPGIFWTHEDNGLSNNLYAVDAEGDFVSKVAVAGAKNVDWEDIAIDDAGFLYVGDTGNNENSRRDLLVYRVEEPDPYAEDATATVSSRIRYRFPTQLAFPDPSDLNYDSEALFFAQDTLFLLTKNRSNTATHLYRFPSLTSTVEVELEFIAAFELGYDVQSQGAKVTAADINPGGDCLAILSLNAIYLFFRPTSGHDWLGSLHKKITLDQDVTLQAEGLTFFDDHLVLTNEEGQLHHLVDVLEDGVSAYP